MMQHEITTSGPLLDGSGNLREPGYAKRLLPIYRRADIKAPASRIKEWDYYLVANDHFAVALTIDDNGYMGLDSISFLHFDERWERTKSPLLPGDARRHHPPGVSVRRGRGGVCGEQAAGPRQPVRHHHGHQRAGLHRQGRHRPGRDLRRISVQVHAPDENDLN